MSDELDFILPPELLDAARKVLDANRAAGRTVSQCDSGSPPCCG